jgi:septal ring factor EnvC (AmiA/AmiB activator)
MVILDHGDGYFTVSGHLDEIGVAVGDVLASGDPVGSAGETGSLTGPRLYFEVRRGAEALDPGGWLRLAPEL